MRKVISTRGFGGLAEPESLPQTRLLWHGWALPLRGQVPLRWVSPQDQELYLQCPTLFLR